jgi:hypothetical protein
MIPYAGSASVDLARSLFGGRARKVREMKHLEDDAEQATRAGQPTAEGSCQQASTD